MCLFCPIYNGNQEIFNQFLLAWLLTGLSGWLLGRLLGKVPESRDFQAPGCWAAQAPGFMGTQLQAPLLLI